MDVQCSWLDWAVSLVAKIPLRLENRSAHEVYGNVQNASWYAVTCTGRALSQSPHHIEYIRHGWHELHTPAARRM